MSFDCKPLVSGTCVPEAHHLWTRRAWVAGATRAAALAGVARSIRRRPRVDAVIVTRTAAQAEQVDPALLYALAQRAVEAAHSAGASYADARLTRTVHHVYGMSGDGTFDTDEELIGVGVRVLVNGCWGFAASPEWTAEAAVQLAQEAVAQATANAIGTIRPVELVPTPVVTGTWATPVQIDPFTIPIEENFDYICYWKACAEKAGIPFASGGLVSTLVFTRQERVLVTSEGTRTAQTRYETGGRMELNLDTPSGPGPQASVRGLQTAGAGWELFHAANLPGQFVQLAEELRQQPRPLPPRPVSIGRYTLVCDGAAMSAIVDQTFGLATQLDRALGYEANASGTSFLNDPLAMVGNLRVAAAPVTITANRSVPGQLATVRWDEDGVEPVDTTLIKDGVLVDFQTTREQAQWLAAYYAKTGRPVRSNGCAVAEDALSFPLQQMPNLALTPSTTTMGVDALLASVKEGLLLEGGWANCDFQGRTGLLSGTLTEIKNGRRGAPVNNGAVFFNTLDFWKNVSALGDATTRQGFSISQYGIGLDLKGEPSQGTSHSVSAPAAVVLNQTVINPARKA